MSKSFNTILELPATILFINPKKKETRNDNHNLIRINIKVQ